MIPDAEELAKEAGKTVNEKIIEALRRKSKDKLYDRIARRLLQGLNAKATKLASHEGVFVDEKTLIDYAERRKYAELIGKFLGAFTEKHEHDIKAAGNIILVHQVPEPRPLEDKGDANPD